MNDLRSNRRKNCDESIVMKRNYSISNVQDIHIEEEETARELYKNDRGRKTNQLFAF